MSLPKEKDKRRGQKDPFYLIPELCELAGACKI